MNKKNKPRNRLSAQAYIDGILKGDRVVLSRAITVIESQLDSDKELSAEILHAVLPHSGNSIRIGVTGVPGVGKSTFIEAIGKYVIDLGHKVAVLSVDPSSKRTKGSILGDKTRMEELSGLEQAYIRPSASGSTLGGVAGKTGESILLCEAAGFDVIFIETVGVGQSETAVHNLTDFFLLLMLAGAGDELQGIKKGIMEMADMIVINKADGDNIRESELAKTQYQNALHLFPPSESGWVPVVSTASSTQKKGIDFIWKKITEYRKLVTENGYFIKNRNRQKIQWMYTALEEEIRSFFYNSEPVRDKLKSLEKAVLESKESPIKAARLLMDAFKRYLK